MIWDNLKEHLNRPVPDATSVFLITMWPKTAQAIRKAKKKKKRSVISFCWCLTSCQKGKIFWRWTPADLSFHWAHLFPAPTTKQVKCSRFSLPPQHQTPPLLLLRKWNPTHSPWSRFVSATLRPHQDPPTPHPTLHIFSTVHFNLGLSALRNSKVISSWNGTCKCAAESPYSHWVLPGVRFIRLGSVEAAQD